MTASMRYNHKYSFLLICLLWLIIQAALLYKNGIALNGEPPKYISEANTLIATGNLSSSNFRLYFVEILLIAIAIKSKLGFGFVIATHLLFSLWATLSIYGFAKKMFSAKAGTVCAILFLLNIPLQEFNVYLQTDSLFYSFTILFTIYLLSITRFSIQHFVIILCSLALLSITRPTGLLIIPSTFVYLFARFNKSIHKKLQLGVASVIFIGFLYILDRALGSGGELDFMLPYRGEHIICGVPTIDHNVDIDTAPDGNSLFGLFTYIAHNFEQFIKMAVLRSKAFFGLMRSYFGTGHNMFLALFNYPIYFMVAAGIRWWTRTYPYHLLYFSMHILVTWGTVILTCDDWHNRFFLTISPWLLLLAAPALNKLIAVFAHNERQPNHPS